MARAGEAAIYQYDAVGNLLGIVRQPASTVAILNFTPKSGPIGTTVTISGTGYSATATQNTVTFNGTTATVASATTTQLIATVPSGATTGPIAVTTPSGSATSSMPFTVSSGGVAGAPTITSFTPTVGGVGTAVTISGTNFDPLPPNNKVRFNLPQAAVSAAIPSTLSTTVPIGATSARITVATPLGTAVSPTDFFVPPLPYTAADVDSTGRIAFGESKTITVSTATHIGLLVFDGVANQRVSMVATSVTSTGSCANNTLTVLKPDGTTLGSSQMCNGSIVGPLTLPVSGTYTVVADLYGSSTGQATITLYDVVDETGPITPGVDITAVLNTPGQRGLWTFSGNVEQRVSMVATSVTSTGSCANNTLTVLKPDGTTLGSSQMCNGSIVGPLTLPVSGTYTVVADLYGSSTGQATITLYDVVDEMGPIALGGTASATLGTPGQRALWTLSGTANQRVSVVVNSSTIGSCVNGPLNVLKPDGTTLSGANLCTGTIVGPVVLPTTGTYTLVVDPFLAYTGQITVALYEVVDVTGTLTIGAAPTLVTITTPTQNANLTFAGTASQQVTARMTDNTISSVTVKLLKPDGTIQTSSSSSAASFNLTQQTLATTGTYTVVIDPPGVNTGSLKVQVTSP